MPDIKIPKECPSCGLEGSLIIVGNEFVCVDSNCGRAFLIDVRFGPEGKKDKK